MSDRRITRKLVENDEAARREMFDIERPTPHCWIQWKGTDVCMDVHCNCGVIGHIDGEFAYHVKCPNCGRVYAVDGHVELIEITCAEGIHADAFLVPDENGVLR